MADEPRKGPDWIQPRRVHRVMAVRACIQADSKLICDAGPYDLVMFVRECEDPLQIEFTGRISRTGEDRKPVTDLVLTLIDKDGEEVIPGTNTDDYGEFGLTADPGARYGLKLGAGVDCPCVLVWDEANW